MTQQPPKPLAMRQRITVGASLLVAGILMFLLFTRDTQPGQQATFGMNLTDASQTIQIPNIVLPVQPTLYVLIAVTVFLGAWQLARAIPSPASPLAISVFFFVSPFLI